MKTKLLFFNFNSCQIFINGVFLLFGLLFLDGLNLYLMIIVTSLGIGLNSYVLWWSYNYKIYDSKILFQCKPTQSLLPFIGISLLRSILHLFYYFGVGCIAVLIMYLEPFKHIGSTLAVLICVVWYIGRVLSTVVDVFQNQQDYFIKQFNLNIDDTVFCSYSIQMTGFISGGFTYMGGEELIYNNKIYRKDDVIIYLKVAGISLSDLNSGHVVLMDMYCYT